MPGQLGAGEGLPDTVIADVGNLAQAVEQAERLQDTGVDADADMGVAGFDPLEGGAGREGAFRHDRHGQPPAATGITDVRSKFAQGSPDGGGRIVRSRHMSPSCYILEKYVARNAQYLP